MSILATKRTRVITQGLPDDAARTQTAMCREYGHGHHCFVAGVDPTMPGAFFGDMPIYGSVEEARRHTGATASVIYDPPSLAAASIVEAIDAELDLVVCITAGIPQRDMMRVRQRLHGSRTRLLGPGCQGLITPGEIRIGTMPVHMHRKGRIGVVSRCCTLTYEAAHQLAALGLGESAVLNIGPDPLGGLGLVDILEMFDHDSGTDAMLLIGEPGSDTEEKACAQWVKQHGAKPVVGFMGGAGARDCGIPFTSNAAEMGQLLTAALPPQWLPFD
jgi:succinyl-CoA synthetase alpha subunit